MSKIFDALYKTNDLMGLADAPLLGKESGPAPEHSAGASEDERIWRDAAGMAAAEAAAEPVLPEPGALDAIRTETLRLSADDPVLPFESVDSAAIEQYRIIRTRLHQLDGSRKLLLATSPGPRDGKTITAINLAAAMSLKANARILLVDADLRRSSISELLGLPVAPGLLDVLRRRVSLDEAVFRIEQFPNCYMLPAGNPQPNPSELLDSPNWTGACSAMRAQFDYVILDGPPVSSVADYHLIEAASDGVLLILRPNHTKRPLLHHALRAIPTEKLAGIILNDTEDWFLWKKHAAYRYQSEPLDVSQMRPGSSRPAASGA